ncbi:MAG: hypothetical protein LH645_05240 [Actinomycetia bacterium]|nr:hypothetical protein [Actinomycetes bacterium]
MDTDLDTPATALYVTADDLLAAHPERVRVRPRVGITPKISDAEPITLAMMHGLLGYTGQLDLGHHGGRTIAGVCTRVAQRVLALTAAIWHNDALGLPVRRSMTA